MQSAVAAVAACPKCKQHSVACRFNYFDRGDLQVHAWEHRCADCGWRETQAYRSDTPANSNAANPGQCPWCGRIGKS